VVNTSLDHSAKVDIEISDAVAASVTTRRINPGIDVGIDSTAPDVFAVSEHQEPGTMGLVVPRASVTVYTITVR
jgi:hypothetical protein